jgi:hypothetical protein
MSEYKGIHGGKIQNFTTNPDNPIEGQVWYNETDGDWKVSSITTAAAWSTGDLMTIGLGNHGGAGTQTAALAFGGYRGVSGPAPTGAQKITQSYNGSAWTEVNDQNTAKDKTLGFGTQTAAINASGAAPGYSALTESYNGTSWTEVNDLNTAREFAAAVSGTSTAGLLFGGQGPPLMQSLTESWNGTSWTEVNDLNTARYLLAGAGSTTAGLAFGGDTDPGLQAITESWNGTSWTEVNDLNTARDNFIGFGVDNTASLAAGGTTPGATANTELYNGTSWTEQNDLNIGRGNLSAAISGTTSAGMVTGGGAPGNTDGQGTEEWNGAGATVTKTITTS